MILKRAHVERVVAKCGNRPLREAAGLAFTFIPHEGNHWFNKAVALVLVVAWLAMFFGIVTVPAAMAGMIMPFSIIVGTIVGRLWGISLENLFPGLAKKVKARK